MEDKPASLLVESLGKALSGIPHLGVVDRWLATPKRARVALRSLSRDRINMLLNVCDILYIHINLTHLIGCLRTAL